MPQRLTKSSIYSRSLHLLDLQLVLLWSQSQPLKILGNGVGLPTWTLYNWGEIVGNCIVRPRRRDSAYLQTQLLIAQKEEEGIQLQAEEFDLMVAAGDLDEVEEVNANCILMANLQQTSTSGTQTNKAFVYVSDGSDEQAQQKQQSLYNSKVLLEKQDPPVVYDSEETLQLA
ncbi:hypothetical protein Tco_0892541 [Tanacetum coccineum]|uniref:Uncharacterized protein n=1 Tax=Tanacetum coccineum TaxID=301880 RepID=A0ABQ5CBK2_9ASTR